MIRAATFAVVFISAIACMSAGLPLWPVFLALAAVVYVAGVVHDVKCTRIVALVVGNGIVAMLLPLPEPMKFLYGAVLWTFLAVLIADYHRGAALALWLMPIGYFGLTFAPALIPLEAWWSIVEVAGVVALLSVGGPLDQLIGDMWRSLGGSGGRDVRVVGQSRGKNFERSKAEIGR